MRTFYPVLATLMVIVSAYFTYMIINVLVTVIKAKKKDHSLKVCLTTAGKAFYIILSLFYWRCPHCQQYLPLKHPGKITHCPHCHKPIK